VPTFAELFRLTTRKLVVGGEQQIIAAQRKLLEQRDDG
jgi:hypothetical protein